jgi:hypothetical protein
MLTTVAESENRMQRRTYGPNREEVTAGWRKLYCDVSPKSQDIEATSFTRQRTSVYPTTQLVGSISVATEPLGKVFTIASSKRLLKSQYTKDSSQSTENPRRERTSQQSITEQPVRFQIPVSRQRRPGREREHQLEKSPDTVPTI